MSISTHICHLTLGRAGRAPGSEPGAAVERRQETVEVAPAGTRFSAQFRTELGRAVSDGHRQSRPLGDAVPAAQLVLVAIEVPIVYNPLLEDGLWSTMHPKGTK